MNDTKSNKRRNRVLFFLWLLVCAGLFEAGYSALYRYGVISPPVTVFIQEETQDTIRFDPALGYRITQTPARMARITHGELEFRGTIEGNNQGFPDDDDFFPERADGRIVRLGVFGDSFTAAQFIEKNWPDRTEERANAGEVRLELLNFSVDGAGLANWWSVLMRHVKPEGYALDGVVFAVMDDTRTGNLYRGFTSADHRESVAHFFQLSDWNPETWPTTYDAARPRFQELPIHILDRERFEAVLDGKWHPDLPRPWGFYAAKHAARLLQDKGATAERPLPVFGEGQQRLAREMGAFCREQSLRVVVVRVPMRDSVLSGAAIHPDVFAFAELVGAKGVLDGADAFDGLTDGEIAAHYFPYDGHWNQKGSDRFATFMETALLTLAEEIARERE